MWWTEHWVELVTLIAIAGAWADMRAYIKNVDEREEDHHETDKEWKREYSQRVRELESHYHRGRHRGDDDD